MRVAIELRIDARCEFVTSAGRDRRIRGNVRPYPEEYREYKGGSFTTVLASTTSDDKERVTIERPESGIYRMKIRGQRVIADDEGCGTNSTLVYFAYVAEDSDRESWENLDAVRPYPLNPSFGFPGDYVPVELP